jgi:ubiquinone/menaquinone biosynthesis C-methylase UbiE
MSYQRLADFLLGLEGIALMRARVEGFGTKSFSDARLDEMRRILGALDRTDLFSSSEMGQIDVAAGYDDWAPSYDSPNPLIELEQPIVQSMFAAAPPGFALDAACGTGRHAEHLASLGHSVVGIDLSAEMLSLAKTKVPLGEFQQGDLRAMPFADGTFDLAVCGLALTHAPDLDEAFAELARVVRPGGRLIVSDIHHLSRYMGGLVLRHIGPGGVSEVSSSGHLPSEYIMAALRAGYVLESFAEVGWPDKPGGGGSLAQEWCPDAARAAYASLPALLVLDLVRG